MKYDSENLGLSVAGDQIWAAAGAHVSDDDKQRLHDLGWFEDESSWSHYANV